MTKEKCYTVSFTFDVHDHSLQFPLKADVQLAASGVYMVTNIRGQHQEEGSLLPPIRLRKVEGRWIFVDMENSSRLSAAIGAAIDGHGF